MKNSKFKIHMTYALGKASLDCKIPPAVATPLDKGGRGDPDAIGSLAMVNCVSPDFNDGYGSEPLNAFPATGGRVSWQ
jgi:hypothetical protein